MERKSINAVLVDEFEKILKEKDLYQKYLDGTLTCSKCGQPITDNNIALIYYDNEYKFRCKNRECMEL